MKLKYKIFITLIFTSCLILTLTISVMQYSIRKNFVEFVNKVEFGKQSKMLALLEKSYEENGGWGSFQDNPMAWHRLLAQSRPEDREGFRPPPMPHDPDAPHRRLCLFDADKNFVAGECRLDSPFDYHPILLSGRTIGWLGLENRDGMRTPLELAFLQKQTDAFYIIGFGILILSLMISYVVSRHILSPIRALASGTRAMRRFDFDARVNVSSSDELGALAADFNRMAQTLKQYETMRKNWISDISHELRTPVAVIRSKIEALQDGIREPTPDLLDSLHKDILGLGKLINDLHQISLMDSKNLSINLKEVPLLSIFDQTLELFLIRFEQQRIEIKKDWEINDIPKVAGDAVLLGRVFSNLLENTLKYTDSPGKMKVACRLGEKSVLIEVEDSQPGVPNNSLESIFERLYRVDQSRNRSLGGSGLGLSMSKEIIVLHKGAIKANHSSLGGLKITIELPIDDNKVRSTQG